MNHSLIKVVYKLDKDKRRLLEARFVEQANKPKTAVQYSNLR